MNKLGKLNAAKITQILTAHIENEFGATPQITTTPITDTKQALGKPPENITVGFRVEVKFDAGVGE